MLPGCVVGTCYQNFAPPYQFKYFSKTEANLTPKGCNVILPHPPAPSPSGEGAGG